MDSQSGVQSLDRALTILELLSEKETVSLSEITQSSGLTKPTVHRLLSALIKNGYVEKVNSGEYKITLKLFKLGSRRIQNIDFMNITRSFAGQLSIDTNETIHVVIQDNTEVLYIDKFESENSAFRTPSKIGKTAPLYSTAVGKALLATYDNFYIRNLWSQLEVRQFTDNTITNIEDFIREIETIRKNGYAVDNEENEYGTFCIGAVFYNFSKKPAGALSLSTFVTNPNIDEYINKVMICAGKISRVLGY